MPRTTRRSLKTIKPISSDIENLVGRSTKSLKHQLSPDTILENDSNVEAKKKNLCSKETQVNLDEQITANDLMNPEGASNTNWRITAEKKQVALQEALEENERLRLTIEELKKEYERYKQMLEEANSFVELFKEEFANGNDDTGIDVNDVSTADETQDGSDETQNETYDSDTSKNGK